jgi:hypothetical protein
MRAAVLCVPIHRLTLKSCPYEPLSMRRHRSQGLIQKGNVLASHSVLCRMMLKLPSITRNITKEWKRRKKHKSAKARFYFELP